MRLYLSVSITLMLFFILSAGSKAQIRNTPPECLPQAFQARIAKCLPINMQNLTEAEVAVAHICNRTECSVQCYDDAIRPCLQTLGNTIDLEAQKVQTRFTCANPQDTLAAMKNCGAYMISDPCVSKAFGDMVNLGQSMILDMNAYSQGYCRILKNYKVCSSTSPLETIGTCTMTQAAMIKNMYDVFFSVKACGIPQNNTLFTTYAGPIRCITPIVG